jgi:hypothetical protein
VPRDHQTFQGRRSGFSTTSPFPRYDLGPLIRNLADYVTLDYVARACECEELAKGATDRQMRQQLEDLARQWWDLARVRRLRVELRDDD